MRITGLYIYAVFGLVTAMVMLASQPVFQRTHTSLLVSPEIERKKDKVCISAGTGKALVVLNRDTFLLPCANPCEIPVMNMQPVLSKIPTSVKWLPPAHNVPRAMLVAAASVAQDEISDWTIRLIPAFHHQLPVISLQVSGQDVFDPINGIYVPGILSDARPAGSMNFNWFEIPFNYTKRGKETECSGFFQFYDQSGKLSAEAHGKFRIHGNATRAYPQKSLRLTFSKKKPLVFSPDPLKSGLDAYRSVILRNSGNDWERTLISNSFQLELLRFSGLEGGFSCYCVVYLNGEYWGIHELSTHVDVEYLAARSGVMKRNVTLIEGEVFSDGDKDEYARFRKLINDCRNHRGITLERLREEIDIDNFLSYISCMVYVANADWPHSNIKCYKSTGSKWKWILHDLDCAFGYAGPGWIDYDVLNFLENDASYAACFFRLCMTDPELKRKLADRITLMLRHELSAERVIALIDRHISQVKPELSNHLSRWRYPATVTAWKAYVSQLKYFARQRGKYLTDMVQRHLR